MELAARGHGGGTVHREQADALRIAGLTGEIAQRMHMTVTAVSKLGLDAPKPVDVNAVGSDRGWSSSGGTTSTTLSRRRSRWKPRRLELRSTIPRSGPRRSGRSRGVGTVRHCDRLSVDDDPDIGNPLKASDGDEQLSRLIHRHANRLPPA